VPGETETWAVAPGSGWGGTTVGGRTVDVVIVVAGNVVVTPGCGLVVVVVVEVVPVVDVAGHGSTKATARASGTKKLTSPLPMV